MLRYKYTISFILGFYLMAYPLVAIGEEGKPVIRTFVDTKSIFIGDRIRYMIEINSKEDLEIELPKFQENRIGDFEIKDSGKKIKKGIFGKRSISNWYDITAYSVGKHLVPSFEIRYREKRKNDWATLKTDELTITVESVLPKREKAKDIKDIKGPIYFFEMNWISLLAALFALTFSILGIIIYKRRRRKIPLKLPHETALEELEAIKGSLAQTGDIKEYYVGGSDCIRRYIERTFRLRAPEMTTEEFLVSLKDSTKLSLEQKGLLKSFLEACDLVKFAKYAPNKIEIEAIYSTAKKFIDQTRTISLESVESE